MEIHKIDVRWLLTQTGSFVIFFINNLFDSTASMEIKEHTRLSEGNNLQF
jgi:hypothetical protein